MAPASPPRSPPLPFGFSDPESVLLARAIHREAMRGLGLIVERIHDRVTRLPSSNEIISAPRRGECDRGWLLEYWWQVHDLLETAESEMDLAVIRLIPDDMDRHDARRYRRCFRRLLLQSLASVSERLTVIAKCLRAYEETDVHDPHLAAIIEASDNPGMPVDALLRRASERDHRSQAHA